MICPRCGGDFVRVKNKLPVSSPGRTWRRHLCQDCGLEFTSIQQAIRSDVDADKWLDILDILDRPLENTAEIEELIAEPPVAIPVPILWFGEGTPGHAHPAEVEGMRGIDFPVRLVRGRDRAAW